ncbi:alpha/beta fold hydrolase [Candidatus Sororendozoicomonas aggregata]|uniref:alpha/beta fold hydrolase n=1 Tax=Candidatus Sororendozoicomonas aggregata TaxID=3073239 RepID=UPI002ED3F87A
MHLFAHQQGQGSDLISIHGLFGSLENLGTLNRSLAANFTVHALDLRNHGRSPHSDTMNYRLMVQDIVVYMDTLGLTSVDLVGHSMGGKVAMSVALQAPERVRKLIVMDVAPVTYLARHDDVFSGFYAIDLDTLKGRSDADKVLAHYVKEKAVRQFLLKNLYKNEHGQYRWRMNLAGIHANYSSLMEGQSASAPFEGDTLFLKGGESDYIQPEHRSAVLSLFPNASVKIIPEAGHWLHAQKPALVFRSIQRFLSG